MITLLSIIGLLNAIYLTIVHNSQGIQCVAGQACNQVLQSAYAAFFGIPLATLGVGVYGVLILLALLHYKKEVHSDTYFNANVWVLVPATAVGLVLVGVQWFYIGGFCPFCLFNSVLLLGLFGLVLNKRKATDYKLQFSASQWSALVLALVLPMAVGHGFTGVSQHSSGPKQIASFAGEPIYESHILASDAKNS